MRRTSFADMPCSIAKTVDVIGDSWTPLILRDAMFGVTRFETFRERLGIPRATLVARLDHLVQAGVIERRTYDEARDRHDYVPTPKGRDLWHALTALRQWGDRWMTETDEQPLQLVHDTCGSHMQIQPACSACGEVVRPSELRLVPGPGYDEAAPDHVPPV